MLTNAAKYDVDDGALLQEIQQLGGYNHIYGMMSTMAKSLSKEKVFTICHAFYWCRYAKREQ